MPQSPRIRTPDLLTRQRLSVPRNPLIADAFYRAGLIERWGRGTNRVIEMCLKAGIRPPTFRQIGDAAVVAFSVPMGSTTAKTRETTGQVTPQVVKVLQSALTPQTREQLQKAAGLKERKHFRVTGIQ